MSGKKTKGKKMNLGDFLGGEGGDWADDNSFPTLAAAVATTDKKPKHVEPPKEFKQAAQPQQAPAQTSAPAHEHTQERAPRDEGEPERRYPRDDGDRRYPPREYNREPREYNREPREYNREPREYNREPREYNREPREPRVIPLPTEAPFTAFVGNLSWDVTKEQLAELFEELAVEEIRLVMKEGKFSGMAYVEFKDLESLTKALDCNGVEWLHRHLKVNVAENRPRPDRRGGFSSRGGFRSERSDSRGEPRERTFRDAKPERELDWSRRGESLPEIAEDELKKLQDVGRDRRGGRGGRPFTGDRGDRPERPERSERFERPPRTSEDAPSPQPGASSSSEKKSEGPKFNPFGAAKPVSTDPFAFVEKKKTVAPAATTAEAGEHKEKENHEGRRGPRKDFGDRSDRPQSNRQPTRSEAATNWRNQAPAATSEEAKPQQPKDNKPKEGGNKDNKPKDDKKPAKGGFQTTGKAQPSASNGKKGGKKDQADVRVSNPYDALSANEGKK